LCVKDSQALAEDVELITTGMVIVLLHAGNGAKKQVRHG
jgi:hypothetical protein